MGRIPSALQAIFLASNGGKDVDVPPKNLGFKVFSGIIRRKNKKQVYNKPNKIAKVTAPTKHASLMAQVPPQEFLDKALKMRGYSTERYNTINSGYSNMPTQLQLVSYDAHILKMIIRDKDEHKIREMLTCGISPNACNKYGETLLHKVCKSGQDKLLQVFLDCGADVQISDGAGRTPMHDACWGSPPSLNTFELLMQQDPYLIHMMDGSGALPLSLVRKENYGAWNAFLVSILDIYWSPRDASTGNQGPPPLALEKANSRPAADPDQALSIELASLVSSGKMKPEDAMEAQSVTDFDDDTSTWFEDDDEEEEDSISFDDAELTELQNFNKFMVTAAY